MIVAHKIRIYPNQEQKNLIDKSCAIQGFIYNWGLNEWQRQYKEGLKPSSFNLKKQFNNIKKEQFPFVLECSKCCVEGAFMNLDKAFKNFFNKITKYPKFKKKDLKNSFYLANDKFSIKNKQIRMPKCKSKIRCAEDLRFNGKIMSGTISRKAGKYYISISVEVQDNINIIKTNKSVGIDLGIKDIVITSDGYKFVNPHWIKNVEKRLKRKQRSFVRMKKGSKNREKRKLEIARLYERITNKKKDYLHKISTWIVRNYDEVGIEDLNIKGMLRNHHIAKALSGVSLYEFDRQLEYKSKMLNKNITRINRWFPSSKTCSVCGCINHDLILKDREWTCKDCGSHLDRDINASINILREAFPSKHGDRPITVNTINSIYQIDWLNHEFKCQNNVSYTLLHN